jgi:hypothetical protein
MTVQEAMMDDETLYRLWYSTETAPEIAKRLHIDSDELLAGWRRLGLITSTKSSRAENHYDGRPRVDELGADPLLVKLKSVYSKPAS